MVHQTIARAETPAPESLDVAGLQVLSGTVVVTRANLEGLDAELTLELVTDDGAQHVSISGGHAAISGCRVVMEPTCPSSSP